MWLEVDLAKLGCDSFGDSRRCSTRWFHTNHGIVLQAIHLVEANEASFWIILKSRYSAYSLK
jgi:hypothetical protein